MFRTGTAQKFYENISPIYQDSRIMKNIIDANGYEMEKLELAIQDLAEQFFIQTATWGLIYWEDMLGIPVKLDLGYQERRNAIMAKLKTRYPITKDRVERILSSLTGANIEIIEDVDDYTFLVNYKDKPGSKVLEVIEKLEEIKPAHLSYWIGSLINEAVALQIRIPEYHSYYKMTNQTILESRKAATIKHTVAVNMKAINNTFDYKMTNQTTTDSVKAKIENMNIDARIKKVSYYSNYNMTNQTITGVI